MDKMVDSPTKRITMVLVDTSAFREANSDFIGLHSALLQSFFNVAREKEIVLLAHPILDKEIKKHIEDSSIYQDYKKLVTQIRKCKDVLVLAECNDVDLFKKIEAYDIKAETYETFIHNYSDAIRLDYPDPELIFEKYFAAEPPFSATGKKKCEFPDAFVIESVQQYLKEHPNEVLLVVSKDGDWVNTFSCMDNVVISNSISDAVTKINEIESLLSEKIISELFESAYNEMLGKVQYSAEYECYDMPAYEFTEDFEVDRVEVTNIDESIVPLKITSSSLLIKTTASISIDGHGVVLDKDSSVWDKEDGGYYYIVYANLFVSGGAAEIECEIKLDFQPDNPVSTVQVSDVRLNNYFNIEVNGGTVTLTVIDPEDDYRGDTMDALEEYAQH